MSAISGFLKKHLDIELTKNEPSHEEYFETFVSKIWGEELVAKEKMCSTIFTGYSISEFASDAKDIVKINHVPFDKVYKPNPKRKTITRYKDEYNDLSNRDWLLDTHCVNEDNVLYLIEECADFLDEMDVPCEDRVMWVPQKFLTMLKNSLPDSSCICRDHSIKVSEFSIKAWDRPDHIAFGQFLRSYTWYELTVSYGNIGYPKPESSTGVFQQPSAEINLCKKGAGSECSTCGRAGEPRLQRQCKFYQKASFEDRCMFLVFGDICDCLEAQEDAKC